MVFNTVNALAVTALNGFYTGIIATSALITSINTTTINLNGGIVCNELGSTPATPASNHITLFVDSIGRLASVNSTGTVVHYTSSLDDGFEKVTGPIPARADEMKAA